ncbi:asparagine synthase C-terminal domain-containing protein [Streptomyces sp. NPDC058664]|uniref:asparagine synthase C-terminal domain-containing protein n=1 Tax=unclassified Streptomyces TaxID=2593676 RepID=UPI00365D2E72
MPTSKWFVVTNRRMADLEGTCQRLDLGKLHLYHQGLVFPPSALGCFDVDVRTMRVERGTGAAEFDPSVGPTTVRVAEDTVAVSSGAFNTDPVFFAAERTTGRFAYFSDLFLSPAVLPALGLPVVLRAPSEEPAGEETLVREVRRIDYSTVQESWCSRRGWTTRAVQGTDLLNRYRRPVRHDPMRAGLDQIEALEGVLGAIDAESAAGTRYCALLSGGIDSGAVTFLAHKLGLPVESYSVGTPWGDEFDAAQELCDVAGVELTRVGLTEDDFVDAVPEAVRWLGHATPEVVEIALTSAAVHRTGALPAGRTLLTGYGSDLINDGLVTPDETDRRLLERTVRAVHRTRFTDELSSRMSLAYGRETHHPFWTWPVMRVALETAPGCKVRDGREKYHLRKAMHTRVPYDIAWRKKVSVHHGGGLQAGIARRLAADTGHDDRRRVYHACFTGLMDAAGRGALDSWPAREVYERAVHRAASGRP